LKKSIRVAFIRQFIAINGLEVGDRFFFDTVHEATNVKIVGVEGAPIDVRSFADHRHRNMVDVMFLHQLAERLFNFVF
jgi:hypothetical protein